MCHAPKAPIFVVATHYDQVITSNVNLQQEWFPFIARVKEHEIELQLPCENISQEKYILIKETRRGR